MNSGEYIFGTGFTQDPESQCCAILNLCKIGIAANDSNAGVDLGKGGYDALFESIAARVWDVINLLEDERTARRRAASCEQNE